MSIYPSTPYINMSIYPSTPYINMSIYPSTPYINMSIYPSTPYINMSIYPSTPYINMSIYPSTPYINMSTIKKINSELMKYSRQHSLITRCVQHKYITRSRVGLTFRPCSTSCFQGMIIVE
ncbi:hypothetical protein CHS0354_005194 [Potamilus streckersoni]|uniref:Uncharacterized protein n=1 Tax=Potamilus streckersoni TaxID=2493646 RepID=A0AAE0RM04_9BIVA|nr:hypothetical protein CHS0354_005194 [Potamilus streckersoni]